MTCEASGSGARQQVKRGTVLVREKGGGRRSPWAANKIPKRGNLSFLAARFFRTRRVIAGMPACLSGAIFILRGGPRIRDQKVLR
jgi:hypothetical protein